MNHAIIPRRALSISTGTFVPSAGGVSYVERGTKNQKKEGINKRSTGEDRRHAEDHLLLDIDLLAPVDRVVHHVHDLVGISPPRPEFPRASPVGAVWFAAAGAVVSSLWGIFRYNHTWKRSFDYHYYIRPLFGAVTGSIGALIYLVLLNLGSKAKVVVDRDTFYVVAFVFGYADYAFLQLVRTSPM